MFLTWIKAFRKITAGESGQALLIIVLVMVVALTVGLSVASRTIINLRNTQEQANSQKALSAAEAGIEQAIKNGSSQISGSLDANKTQYSTTKSDVIASAPFLVNGGNKVTKNDAIYVWLSDTNFNSVWPTSGTSNLTIYWGDSSDPCSNAALEVAVIKGPKTAPTLTRFGFDPCSTRQSTNHFQLVNSSGSTTISGVKLYYHTDIPISNGLLVRVDPIYQGAYIGSFGSGLPNQGTIYTSTGTTTTGDSNSDVTTRKVTVFQGFPEVPAEFFPYTLFQP